MAPKGGDSIGSLTDSQKVAIDFLLVLLKKARRRWSLLVLVGVAAGLAAFASPRASGVPSDTSSFLTAIESLRDKSFPKIIASTTFQEWLPVGATRNIDTATQDIARAAQALGKLGDAIEVAFFTLGPAYEAYAKAVRQLKESPPSRDFEQWQLQEARAALIALAGLKTANKLEKGSEYSQIIDGTVVVHKTSSTAQSIAELKGWLRRLPVEDNNRLVLAHIGASVEQIEAAIDSLLAESHEFPAGTKESLETVVATLDHWNIATIRTATELARANFHSNALSQGSVSAIGFSIPGVAIRILAPLIALGLALDLVMTLRKAVSWSRRNMLTRDVRHHLRLFSWIPILTLDGRKGSDFASKILAAFAILVHFATPVFLAITLVDNPHGVATMIIAATVIIGITVAQLQSLRLLSALDAGAAKNPVFALDIDERTASLVHSHIDRAEFAWSTLITVSATVSIFFVSFLVVPQDLIRERSNLVAARDTRPILEAVYRQRFLDHRDTYAKWSKAVFDQFHHLTFLPSHLPESHPAHDLSVQLSNDSALSSYFSATSNFDDIVTQDRASIAELDVPDLRDLAELLYRNDLDEMLEPLIKIRAAIRRSPLPEEVAKELPGFLRSASRKDDADSVARVLYGKASTTSARQRLVPDVLPITYRQFVAKGGFAYRLTALPNAKDVEHLISFLKAKGMRKLSSFDNYSEALARLDEKLGTIKLTIIGVQIDRQLAQFVASWIIVALIGLLLLRIVVAKRIVHSLDHQCDRTVLLSMTKGTFLSIGMKDRAVNRYFGGIIFLTFPILVLLLITAQSEPNLWPISSVLLGLIVALLLSVLVTIERWRLLSKGL